MGKHGKKQITQKGGRSQPYPRKTVEKARVDVTYEGEAPAPATSPSTTPAKARATKLVSPGPAATGPVPSVDKGKGKARALPVETETTADTSAGAATSSQSTFVVVAGSYEKLLYGLEGTASTRSPSYTLDPIFIFPAHLACVKAVAASPGGKWLATGSEDEFIKVWDLRRRKEVGSLSQHAGSITSLQFPTSAHLVSTSVDGTIALFRTADWALLKSLKGHSGRVNHVDVHPTGRVALSVGKDKTLRMWDLMRGRGAASLPLSEEAEMVRFSPEGTHLAVLYPKKVEVYTLSLKLLHTFETKSRFTGMEFATLPHPADEENDEAEDEQVLCLGTEKGTVEVWDLSVMPVDEAMSAGPADEEDGEDRQDGQGEVDVIVSRRSTLVGHKNRIKSLSALTFGSAPREQASTLLASASSDGFIHLYDLSHSGPDGREPDIEPCAVYDTKGSRLTCVFLAEGRTAAAPQRYASGGRRNGAAPEGKTEEENETGDDADMYEDAEEASEDGSAGVEVDYEGEEEGEDEEGEYE